MTVETLLPSALLDKSPIVSISLPANLLQERELRRVLALQLVIKLTGSSFPTTDTAQQELINMAKRIEVYLNSGG